MTDPIRQFALALGLALAAGFPAFAQETTAPAATAEAPAAAPAEGAPAGPDALNMGEPVTAPDGPGTTYIAASFEAWQQKCVRTEDGSDPCQLYQLLRDAQGNAVAEISLFGLAPGGQAVAGATVIAPLETLLTEQLTIAIDDAAPKRYPFTWCSGIGCIARVGFTAEEVDAFRKGNVARISIVPVVAPDRQVVVEASLKGFTAGLDAVNAANAPKAP